MCRCVYIACLACSARTEKYDCREGEPEASAKAEAEARAHGWVLVPAVAGERPENWICARCAADIGAAAVRP